MKVSSGSARDGDRRRSCDTSGASKNTDATRTPSEQAATIVPVSHSSHIIEPEMTSGMPVTATMTTRRMTRALFTLWRGYRPHPAQVHVRGTSIARPRHGHSWQLRYHGEGWIPSASRAAVRAFASATTAPSVGAPHLFLWLICVRAHEAT